MKIAIIGSGISGMGAAYLLNPHHDITLYEKEDYIGGHSFTLDVMTPHKKVAVDIGFIVFNYRNYPNLAALFDHLDVPVAKSGMLFGVSIDGGWLEYGTRYYSSIFAQKRNILRSDFRRMIRDIFRFNKRAKAFVAVNPQASMGQCVQALDLGEWFTRYYLLALGGAIWSTPLKQMLRFPAITLIEFFDNHGLLTINDRPQWYTVRGGSREYVRRLTASFRERIRLNCGVERVHRHGDGVDVTDEHGRTECYDQVILACHSDQALRLIENPTICEKEILGNIRYQPNRLVLHSDTRFMPKRKKAWASWVYLSDERYNKGSQEFKESAVSLSYWMNNLQPLGVNYPIIVTLNPARDPDPSLLHNEHVFEHPVFDQSAIQAQKRISAIQGQDRLWFCGAWQRYGFHEDGLSSAIDVAKELGAEPPWKI